MTKSQQPLSVNDPVKPFMFYADVWHRNAFDKIRMQAYKDMELEGQIRILKVTYSRKDQMVVIEYRSAMPHQWVLDDLKRKVYPVKEEQTSLL